MGTRRADPPAPPLPEAWTRPEGTESDHDTATGEPLDPAPVIAGPLGTGPLLTRFWPVRPPTRRWPVPIGNVVASSWRQWWEC